MKKCCDTCPATCEFCIHFHEGTPRWGNCGVLKKQVYIRKRECFYFECVEYRKSKVEESVYISKSYFIGRLFK